ncbi:MAG: hypothetical protein KJO18_07420, partial [Acidimicrobiia bacterium]|nr:hypothetical protein [Acidimicrobiia bacterium]
MAWNLGNNRTPTRRDEDTRSRMFQAKSALDTVMQTLQDEGAGVNLGFATFPDQNGHYAYSKVNTFLGQYISDRETDRDWCRGFEPTDDGWEDVYRGYTFKWPQTTINDGLKSGDIVPLNWADDNIQNIRERLAPNLALGETTPDYGIARYFQNRRNNGQLRLRDNRA